MHTIQPGWECCDDRQMGCQEGILYICKEHKRVPITDEECVREMNDPRRPELATYGTFCDRTPAGTWMQCAGAEPVDQHYD